MSVLSGTAYPLREIEFTCDGVRTIHLLCSNIYSMSPRNLAIFTILIGELYNDSLLSSLHYK